MSSRGGESAIMDANWIPAVGAGFGGSIIAWILSWRIASARAEEQQAGEARRAQALRDSDLKRAEELRVADARRADELRSDLREMRDAWNEGVERVQRLAQNMASLQASQNQVNGFTAKAIDGITATIDRHGEEIADLKSTVRLLVGTVTAAKA